MKGPRSRRRILQPSSVAATGSSPPRPPTRKRNTAGLLVLWRRRLGAVEKDTPERNINRDRNTYLRPMQSGNRSHKPHRQRHADLHRPSMPIPSQRAGREIHCAKTAGQAWLIRIHRIKQPNKPGGQRVLPESAERQIFQTIQNH